MKESTYLHVGDPVWWQGGWGTASPKLAEVFVIERDCDYFSRRGSVVDRLLWHQVRGRGDQSWAEGEEDESTLITLTNGHWAYGWQVTPVKMWVKNYEETEQERISVSASRARPVRPVPPLGR